MSFWQKFKDASLLIGAFIFLGSMVVAAHAIGIMLALAFMAWIILMIRRDHQEYLKARGTEDN
jgi:hypothetical protein